MEIQQSNTEYFPTSLYLAMYASAAAQSHLRDVDVSTIKADVSSSDWLANLGDSISNAWDASRAFGVNLLEDAVTFGADCFAVVGTGVVSTVQTVTDVGTSVVDGAVDIVDTAASGLAGAAGNAVTSGLDSLLGSPKKFLLVALAAGGALLIAPPLIRAIGKSKGGTNGSFGN